MKKSGIYTWLSALVLLLSTPALAQLQSAQKDIIQDLVSEIGKAPVYDAAKERSLEVLKSKLRSQENQDAGVQYITCLNLYDGYKVYNYDSAFGYAKKLQQLAQQLNDPDHVANARLKLGFTLLSSGMFKETMDSLSTMNVNGRPDSIRAEYYSLMGRFYYDLADFDNDVYHTPSYLNRGNKYIDSALQLSPPTSFQHLYFKGLRAIRSGDRSGAKAIFEKIISDPALSQRRYAITASTLSDFYIQSGQTDTAILLLAASAIADIRSSTKETSAILHLSQLLYKKGDVKNASLCIQKAIEDAGFYGARQRKVQVSDILPLIEGQKLTRIEQEKRILLTYAIITTFLLLVVVALVIVVYRQIRKLKEVRRIISDALIKEQEINHQLQVINDKLAKANKIKI